MIQHAKVVAAAVTLMCLGFTVVVTNSLSTVNFLSRRQNNIRSQSWKKQVGSLQCPSPRSSMSRFSSSRLNSISDFSSHPYSVYYGTSGSTANQNFGQNDDINDVYGYGPDERGREEGYDGPEPHGPEPIGLRSMQDVPLMSGGRRGAAVFGTKYDEDRQPYYDDPRIVEERERLFHEERFIEDQHMMDEMDSLAHERDDLQRKLDAVVNENIHLQTQRNINGGPQYVPPEQNQYSQAANHVPGHMDMGQNQSTMSVVDSVMEELKNMRRTVQAVEAGQQQRNSPTTDPEAPTVESIKSELREMEVVLENLGPEHAPSCIFATNVDGYDALTGETQPEYNSENDSASVPSNLENNLNEPRVESPSSDDGSKKLDHTQLFDAYEVVIKAELKKKNGFEERLDPVEKQIDVTKDPISPTVCEGSFGSKYI